jgi:hypothetical protein
MNKYTEYKTCALLINEEYLSRTSKEHTRSDVTKSLSLFTVSTMPCNSPSAIPYLLLISAMSAVNCLEFILYNRPTYIYNESHSLLLVGQWNVVNLEKLRKKLMTKH